MRVRSRPDGLAAANYAERGAMRAASGFPRRRVGGIPVAAPRRPSHLFTTMRRPSLLLRIGTLALTLALILAVYLAAVRPWLLGWGATPEEMARSYPVDTVGRAEGATATRAITIAAPPAEVWPWVAQTGQERGGFHSYDLLENLVGCEMPYGDTLLPDRQTWALGDKLWMYPPTKGGGVGFATLRVLVPGRQLGFGARSTGTSLDEPEDGSWGFILEPIGRDSTRLIMRGAGASGRSRPWLMFDQLFFEPVHFMMERRMMLGLKALAEGRSRRPRANDAMAVLFLVSGVLLLAAIIAVLVVRHLPSTVGALVAAATAVQLLTLVQPPLGVSLLLVLSTISILAYAFRRSWRERKGRQR